MIASCSFVCLNSPWTRSSSPPPSHPPPRQLNSPPLASLPKLHATHTQNVRDNGNAGTKMQGREQKEKGEEVDLKAQRLGEEG